MKKILGIVASCLLVHLTQAQTINSTAGVVASPVLPAPTAYAVVSRDANSAVWQQQTYDQTPDGSTVASIHRYVELATGLNHLAGGRWVPSSEDIVISPDGSSASAINGQHQAYFPGNIYSGQIRLVTPDGQVLQSEPVGLSYSDGNNSVLLAVVTNATGAILPSGNQVIYQNAFAGLNADLVYTYTKAGFEQDVILRQQPPDPDALGLNPQTTRLQVLTEFFSAPNPNVRARMIPTAAGDLEDDDLSFGAMEMGQGKAFLLGTNSPSAGVNKRWLTLQRRQFLIEEVPIVSIATAIDTLPPFVGQAGTGRKPDISKNLILPPLRLVHLLPKSMFLAQAEPPGSGLVLDYQMLVGSLTNYTFQGDTTYYISGTLNLLGTNIFEGGAVIKYTNGASISLPPLSPAPVLNWQSSAYRPVVFTARDDNSVGEAISGSTGNPTNYYANPAFSFAGTSTAGSFNCVRFAYARQVFYAPGAGTVTLSDAQLVNCQNGIYLAGNSVNLRNVLFANVLTNFNNLTYATINAQNVTFANSLYLATTNVVVFSNPLTATNCIFANVTNLAYGLTSLSGGNNGFYSSPPFGSSQFTNTSNPFQTVGGGSYYLASTCSFTNKGTANIDATLLGNLRKKTTHPPIVYSNLTISVQTNFSPRVSRDTNSSPDLGYHYDPLDYITDTLNVTNATMTVSNGTAIACYNRAGISLRDGSSLVSVGTPVAPNWFVRYQSVQEQPIALGSTNVSSGQNVSAAPYGKVGPKGTFQFTHFATPAAGGWGIYHRINTVFASLTLQNSELWGGANDLSGWTNSTTVTLMNNLFWRSTLFASNSSAQASLYLTNNLFWGISSVTLSQPSSGLWKAYNNDFDTCTITNSQLTNGYNAYLNCNGYLKPTNSTDLFVANTLAYQTSWFGTFYQPTNSPLIQKGSTNANSVGLYHFTVTTNEVVEGTNIVSIGYHYIATDAYGNPLDSNGNGIPDYLEDANGDGIVDNGESNWALAILTQPATQYVTPGSNATFTVGAYGVLPLSYQWYFIATTTNVINGATNSSWTVTNAQPINQGSYFVVVSNFSGSLTSAVAQLILTCDPAPSGLVAWWRGESNVLDSIGTNNGTYTRGVTFTQGVAGLAFKFDGTNGTITIPDSPVLKPTNFTIEAWVNFSSSNSWRTNTAPVGEQYIIEKPNQAGHDGYILFKLRDTNTLKDFFVFGINTSGTNQWYSPYDIGSDTGVQRNGIQTNQWYHIAGVLGYNSGSNYEQLYVNGQLAASTNFVGTINYGNYPLFFGWSGEIGNTWDARLEGSLDEVSLYNRALSSNEIMWIYEAGTNHFGKCLPNPAPIVQIISPTNNAWFGLGSNITVTAAAYDVVDAVTNVQFYYYPIGGLTNLIVGTVTQSGTNWSVVWTNAPIGSNAIYAVATDYTGLITTSAPPVNIAVLVPPIIIQQPVNVTTNIGGNATFSVTVSSISTLPLSYQWWYDTNTLLVGAMNATLTLTNVQPGQAGTYSVVVTNIAGSAASSNALLTVTNGAPTVQIVSPINQTLLARSNVIISATATNFTAGATNVGVEFFANGTNDLGFSAVPNTNGYYQIGWTPATGGTNILTAFVTNSAGLTNWSSPVTNYVRNLPTVTITSPTNGQIFSLSNAMTFTNITISAAAVGDRASITNVAFYQGTNFIKAVTNAPYQITWTATNGTYVLTAQATDSNGVTGVSFPVNITIEPTNQPPLVYAGPNQTVNLSTNPVQLAGLVSDDGLPLGSVLLTTWTNLNGGSGVTFADPSQPATSVHFSATGTYQFVLSANDGQYTVYSTNTITVLPPNVAPTVDAGTNQTIILGAQYTNTFQNLGSKRSKGKEYWLGFPDNYGGGNWPVLLITSETNAYVSVMAAGLGLFTNCWVSPNQPARIGLTNIVEEDNDNVIQSKGIHIISQNDISVYGMSYMQWDSDGYCGLPVNALGTNYLVLGWEGEQMGGINFASEFLIVGTVKNTTVHISPKATDISGARTAGSNYTVVLNAGQTYQLQSLSGDLSGTSIIADKPVAVFGGSEIAYIPLTSFGFGNFLVEQIPPVSSWGQEFFTVPFVRDFNEGDIFRILASADGTSIYTNGNPMITLTNGEVFQFSNSEPWHIVADKPILLAQYAIGSETAEGEQLGDPSMMLVPPAEQFLSSYTISATLGAPYYPLGALFGTPPDPDYPYFTNFVNIAITNSSIDSIVLDGTNISSSVFTNIPGTGYSFAQLSLLPGTHHFHSSAPFGLFVYSFAGYEAYSYPGGMSLGNISTVSSITLSSQAPTNDILSTTRMTARVSDQNDQPVAGVRVDFHVTGSNSVDGFNFTDPNGVAMFSYIATNRGADIVYASAGTQSAVATNVWTWPNFILQGSVWDDGLPSGVTNITWTQLQGPASATFSDIHAINPVVTVTGPGYYVFQLEGDDTQLTNYSTVVVSVIRNQAPSADAGTNQIVTGVSTILNGNVSDDGLPDGVTNISWTEVGGPGTVTFSNVTQAATIATFTAPGDYVLRLTADDNQATVSSDLDIEVVPDTTPIGCGDTVNGTITSNDLHSIAFTNSFANYYQITGQYNEQITVTTTNSAFDSYLAIRDSQWRILAEDDDNYITGNTNARVIYTLPADGTYIIEVASSVPGQTGSYTLDLSCGSAGTNLSSLLVLTYGQTVPNNATVDFGTVQVGSPISMTFTITNQGTAPLSLGPVFVSGDFKLVSAPISLIAPSNSTTLTVQYNASTNGSETGVLTFTDNDAGNNPFVLNLDGTANIPGGAPTVNILYPTNNTGFPFRSIIPVIVSATAATGTIAEVDFYASMPWGSVLFDRETTPTTGNQYDASWYAFRSGTISFSAVAIDNAGRIGYATSPVTIQVGSPNTDNPPVAVNDHITVLANSVNNVFDPRANDSDPDNDPLTIISVTTPEYGTAAIVNNGMAVSYTPEPGTRGTDGFHYEVSDGRGGTAWAQVLVSVYATDQPTVNLVAANYTTNAGAIDPLIATVSPYQNIAKVDFYQGNVLIGEVTNGYNGLYTNYWLAVANPCACGFYAQAYDIFGQVTTSSEISINVTTNGLQGTLTASLDSIVDTNGTTPLASTNLVTVRDGLFTLYGRAFHSLGSNVVWQLGVYSQDGTTLLRNLTPASTSAVGSISASGILLTNCDLTTLQNGVYNLRLTALGGYQMTSADIQFILDSNLKLGQFSFSQQDLVIPVNGIPLTVTRTYNSLNPDKGDFGYGWTYSLSGMDVALDETREDVPDLISGGSTHDSPGGLFSMRTSGGRDVTLTLPNGQRTTFYYNLIQINTLQYRPAWQAEPGVTATLGVQGNPVATVDPISKQFTWTDNKSWNVPYNYFDFAGFVLTNQDGTVYYLNRADMGQHNYGGGDWVAETYGVPYLSKIVQRSGDTIVINPGSIAHLNPQGQTTSQITIQRNADGLITSITDPIGGLPAVKYEYDSQDNLIAAERLVDRSGIYVTNSFAYGNPNLPHYITGIINGDGTQVAENFYDPSGKLIAVQDANGNRTQYIHNTTNNTELIIDALGNTNIYVYDLRGNIILETNALGQATANSYDNNNNLLSTTDPLGHTTSYAYDANNNRTAVTNALGQATHFNFDNFGDLLSKTDALMNATSFAYDSTGHRTKVTDAMNNSTTFSHDLFGRPNAVTNALGQLRATAGSDSSGNLAFVSQVGGLQMNFSHDLNGNTTNTTFTNQTQALTTVTVLDAANRVTRVTDPDGHSRTTVYDLAGRVSQNVDRMGNTNFYIYDPVGNLIQTTYADGSVSRNVYDADNRVIYSDDRHQPGQSVNGTHNVYDPLGRVIQTERLANVRINVSYNGDVGQSVFASAGAVLSTSSTAYDAAGRVLAATNALGYVTQYQYDAVGRQTAVIDALTNRTDSVYDAAGQLRYTTNALGGVTEYQYDAKDRRIKTIFPDHSFTTNSYNATGQLMFVKDQLGLETDYQYDNLGRMTNIAKPQVFDPVGGTNASPQWNCQYDLYGNILSLTDPKQRQTKFTYDALGELISRTLPLLQTNFNAYNSLGQLAWSADFNGQSNVMVYDSLGRMATNFLYATGATTPSQTNVFLYDANGRLYQTIRPEGVTTFRYNLDGQVTNIVSPEGWISYEYDPAMNYLMRAYTANSDVRYGYDALNRLATVKAVKRDGVTLTTPEVTTNDYTKLGSLQDVFYPNGVHAVYQYDVMNRLTNLTYQAGITTLATYSYKTDADSRRTNAVEILRQENGSYLTNTLTWQYDNLNRLANDVLVCSASSASYTNSYSYDLAGNRLSKVHIGGTSETVTYTSDSNDELTNEVSSVNPTATYRYDANGSLTNKTVGTTVNSYSYNLENKLATVAIKGVTSAAYQYDSQGVRISSTIGGNTTNYLIDANNLTGYPRILEELPAVGGTPSRSYTIGNEVLAQSASGTVSYLLEDGHGNNRQLTSTSGAVSSHYNYDAYGMVQTGISSTTAEAAPTSLLYCGEQYDSVLHMYNLRARYYLPGDGIFNQRDALDGIFSDPQSLHKYTYCQNNPVNMSDPTGNQGDIGSLSVSMAIASGIEDFYNLAVAYQGYRAAAKVTEIGQSFNSTVDAASRDASPGVDTATIIVHGVSGHVNGWSQSTETPFQQDLTLDANQTPKPVDPNSLPLNHDFYEFDWGGFSVDNIPLTLIPIKSVHEMALVQLRMEEMLVSMNGYANIDIISHSWGTCLSYDLLNSSSIEVHNWVTMGSPLKPTTDKPAANAGNWINYYSLWDPVVHLEMYPPFPNTCGMPLPSWSWINPGLTDDQSVDIQHSHYMGHLLNSIQEHGAYWNDYNVLSNLRKDLQ